MKTAIKDMETKVIGGKVTECKQVDINGKPVGIVKGYIATYDVDRGDDRFTPGAFAKSLAQLQEIGKTHLPLKDTHGRTIGGWPMETLREDSKGLYGEGHINLEVEQGREAYSLAQQGVYDSFSIGYRPTDVEYNGGVRVISESDVFEGSLLDIPMNLNARVTEVKTVTPFRDLPLADADMAWDSTAALRRVREWAGAAEGLDTSAIQGKYRNAFFWYNPDEADVFSGYKLPFADIIDGTLTAVPRGIFAAAAAMRGARGGVDIPESDRAGVRRHIERYYSKMDRESPFDEQRAFKVESFDGMQERTLEALLQSGVCFSGKLAKTIVSFLKGHGLRDAANGSHRDDDEDWAAVIGEIKSIQNKLEEKKNA